MKIIWSIVALLLFGSAAVILLRAPASPRPLAGRPAQTTPAPVPQAGTPGPEVSTPAPSDGPAPAAPSVSAAPPASATAADVPAPSATAAAAPAPLDAAAPTPAPSNPDRVLADLANVQMPGVDAAETAKPAEAGEAVTIPDDPAFPAARLMLARVTRRADGSLQLDGRFTITGAGTKADPYRVPWDLLVSAQDVYKPRMGQTRLPQRVTLLNNKYVELTGYIAFPITAASPKEMLMMLNQWDGCCIGVPPTAYDAVEVKLTDAATPQQRFHTRGGVRGRFKVDPYEDGGWLLGLYILDDATLVSEQ